MIWVGGVGGCYAVFVGDVGFGLVALGFVVTGALFWVAGCWLAPWLFVCFICVLLCACRLAGFGL